MSRIDSIIIKFALLSGQVAELYGIHFQNPNMTVDNAALIRVQGMTLLPTTDPGGSPLLQFDAHLAEAEYAVPQEVFGAVRAWVGFYGEYDEYDDRGKFDVDMTVVAVVYGEAYELGRAVVTYSYSHIYEYEPIPLDWSAVPATPPEHGRFWTNHNLTYEVP